MLTRILIATGLAAGLMVSAASATTIVNTDKSAHMIAFLPKGGHTHHYSVAAHHQRGLDCKPGGTVTLGKSSLACDAKTAKITIKAGKLVL